MGDGLLALVRDVSTTIEVALAANVLATALILLGATALAGVAVALIVRTATLVATDVAGVPRAELRLALALRPLVAQSNPAAAGHVRTRAPDLLLG